MEIGVGQAEDTELSCLCVSVRARGDSREIFVRKHYCFCFARVQITMLSLGMVLRAGISLRRECAFQ